MNKELIYTDIQELISISRSEVKNNSNNIEKEDLLKEDFLSFQDDIVNDATKIKKNIAEMCESIKKGDVVSSKDFNEYEVMQKSLGNLTMNVGICIMLTFFGMCINKVFFNGVDVFLGLLFSLVFVVCVWFTKMLIGITKMEKKREQVTKKHEYMLGFIFEIFNSSNFIDEKNIDKNDFDEKLLKASIEKFKMDRLNNHSFNKLSIDRDKLMKKYKEKNIIDFE